MCVDVSACCFLRSDDSAPGAFDVPLSCFPSAHFAYCLPGVVVLGRLPLACMLSSALTPSSLNPNSHCLDQPYRIRPLLLMIAMHPPLLIPPLLHQVIDIPLWFASAASCTSSVHVSNSMVRAPCLRCASLCCPKTYLPPSSAFTRLLLSVGASLTVSGSFCACVAPLVYKKQKLSYGVGTLSKCLLSCVITCACMPLFLESHVSAVSFKCVYQPTVYL